MIPNCEVSPSCSLVVDVVLQSSDGERLGAHSKNLELFTDAFPAAGSTLPPDANGEVVQMTESAQVIRLMLCFTHNIPPPDLTSLNLDTLLAFSEAVQCKYGMYQAAGYVRNEINRRIPMNPLEILEHKTRISDLTMIDQVARRTMDIPLQEVFSVLTDLRVSHIWVQYREQWREALPRYKNAVQSFAEHIGTGFDTILKPLMNMILVSSTIDMDVLTNLVVIGCVKAARMEVKQKITLIKDISTRLPRWENF